MVVEFFLTDDECEFLIQTSKPFLSPSLVVSATDGITRMDDVRTSSGTSVAKRQHPQLRALEDRLVALTGIPIEHSEGFQVMHYEVGQQYTSHYDYFFANTSPHLLSEVCGGQRSATVILYLNTVSGGGDTEFPNVGHRVVALKGNACFFSYLDEAGALDAQSLHRGNPVASGEKWIATWWVREKPIL